MVHISIIVAEFSSIGSKATMKFLAISILLLASGTLLAQDYPRYELSAGYSYGSVDTQGYGTQRSAQGWSGSVAANLRRWVGIEGEISSQFQTFDFALQGNNLQVDSRYYSFLGGPRFAYRTGKATPFFHGLFGLNRSLDYGSTAIDPLTGEMVTPYANGLATAVGGGFDYAISRKWAFRSQADYFFTKQASTLSPTANNFRVLAAIVFTFGQRESEVARKSSKSVQVAKSTATVAPNPDVATMENKQPGSSSAVTESASVSETQQTPNAAPALAVAEAPSVPSSTLTTGAPNHALQAAVQAPKPETASATKTEGAPTPQVASSPYAGPNTVVISQSTPQWQASPKQEESLGDVARRYRQKKMLGTATSTGL